MATNNKRSELLQEFFESLTTLNRLVGDANRVTVNPEKFPDRRRKERRHPQTELLYSLSRKKEMTIKEIAKSMFITSSAATQMVENMVKQGLVQRLDDPRDRRVVKVQLTQAGKTKFNKFKKGHMNELEKVLKNLSTDEIKYIVQIRKKIISKIV